MHRFVFISLAVLSILSLPGHATASADAGKAAELKSVSRVAKGVVSDPGAKRIHRSVANEVLKPLSTKDAADEHASAEATEPAATDEAAQPAKVTVEEAPGVRAPAANEGAKVEVAGVPKASDEHGAKPVAKHDAAPSVSPEQALSWLQNGNKRYLSRSIRTDGRSQKDRDRLSKGQHPHAIVLTCSDSRVPPETIFDQTLGEIFVIRTAGEGLDASVIASIEYAVEHLGPKLLVVMGHTSCGAVKAAIETPEDKTAGSPSLDALLADIRPRIPNRTPASHGVEIESAANAQGVAADLLKRSEIIRNRVEKGDLKIKPSLYYIDSGVVKFY